MVTQQDREVLRVLAAAYMEAAGQPAQKEKVALWKALNRGGMQRPMVVIDQLPWNELNGEGELSCQVEDPFWRSIEKGLRRQLYKWRHCPVDMVLEPYITIPKDVRGASVGLEVKRPGGPLEEATGSYGLAIQEETAATEDSNDVISHHYDNQLQEEEDIAKIKDMHLVHNEAQSALWMEEARHIFEGVAPVKQSGGVQFHVGLWDFLSQWMGVEDIYFDLIDRPEFIHKVMQRLTDATLAGIADANRLGVYDDIASTCHCSYVFDDEMLPQPGQGRGPTTQNGWAFGMAQLFTSVSPATTEEFEIPYISRIAEEFGHIYYGCCDRLDDRMELVKGIPNVAKISCSPWSDAKAFAEKIGPTLIMSVKPNPAHLATEPASLDEAEAEVRRILGHVKANGVNAEFILKDVSTVKHQPQRITQWAERAMRAVSE